MMAEARAERSSLAWRAQALESLLGQAARHAAPPPVPIPLAAVQAAPAWLLLGAPAIGRLAQAMGAARAAAALRDCLDGAVLSAFADAAGEDLADWALSLEPEPDIGAAQAPWNAGRDGPAPPLTADRLAQDGRQLLAGLLADETDARPLASLLGATPAAPHAPGLAARLLQLALARAGNEAG
jgi:hypothetical protein